VKSGAWFKNNARDAKIRGPDVGGVGDDAVGAVFVDELLQGVSEKGDSFVVFREGGFEGWEVGGALAALGEADLGGGEGDQEEVHGMAATGGLVDGAAEVEGVRGGGDEGDPDARALGEEPGHVDEGDDVGGCKEREEE